MTVAIKNAPVLVQAGNHSLELEQTSRGLVEPFAREEVYPILELDAPRVGLVRARCECNRYVASSYDEASGRSSPVWSEWRIFLRDVTTPDPERPELFHLGRYAAGVGDATRAAILAACQPVVEAWIGSEEYLASRRRAAAYAVAREIDAPPDYRLSRAAATLERAGKDLDPVAVGRLEGALALLAQARQLLDEATA